MEDTPAVWWHSQNLNEDGRGREAGSAIWHGRAWLNFFSAVFGVSWNLRSRFMHSYVQIGGEDREVKMSVALPPIAIWVWVERVVPRWMAKRVGYDGRKIGISLHDGGIWVDLWRDPMSGSVDLHFNPADFFLGKREYAEVLVESRDVQIALPERTYAATVRIYEARWKRPRWPSARRRLRADVTPEVPIPVPGKGENSWDIEEDAICSHSCNAGTVPEAVANMVRAVLSTRERYGGSTWIPEGAP